MHCFLDIGKYNEVYCAMCNTVQSYHAYFSMSLVFDTKYISRIDSIYDNLLGYSFFTVIIAKDR